MAIDLPCPPRFGTLRNPDRLTYGPRIEAAHRALTATKQGPGARFMPHQRYVYDVSQEIDPATGHRWYNTVVLVVPRQAGKTTGVEGMLTWSGNRADKPDSTSVYLAQNRDKARLRVLDEWELKRLRRSPATKGRYKARKSNGSEGIFWTPTQSKLLVQASNAEAGHSLTIDGEAVIDEAWAFADLTVVQAMSPTMVTCPDAQLWVTSTAGDGGDGLLQHYQDVGAAALNDPESRVAFFEWSAPPGAPTTDPATWAATIPSWGFTVDEAAIRQQLVNLGEPEFDRAFLCRRRVEQYESKIPPAVWARQLRDAAQAEPIAPFVLALDIAADRSAASIAAAALTAAGELVVITDTRPGTSWLLRAARDLQQARRPAAIIADRRAPIGSMIDRLALELGPITEPDTVEFGHSAGLFVDGLVDGEVVHVGQAPLDTAAAQARTRPLGDAFAWNRRESPCDISPLCVATLAVWGHRKLYPEGAARGRIQ